MSMIEPDSSTASARIPVVPASMATTTPTTRHPRGWLSDGPCAPGGNGLGPGPLPGAPPGDLPVTLSLRCPWRPGRVDSGRCSPHLPGHDPAPAPSLVAIFAKSHPTRADAFRLPLTPL